MNKETFDKIWAKAEKPMREEEARTILQLVESLSPKTILEIGVGPGKTFRLWSQILPKKGVLVGVDWRNKIRWKWREMTDIKIKLAIGDSRRKATVQKVAKILKERKVDFMFIDATHTYEAVKKDFYNYLKFMKEDGIVALHDIRAPDTKKYQKTTTVSLFYAELKKIYKTMDILPKGEWKGSDGIGVIFLE